MSVKRHVGDWPVMKGKINEFLDDAVENQRDMLILCMDDETCGFVSSVPNEVILDFLMTAIGRLAARGIIKPDDMHRFAEEMKKDVTLQ
jgi:hypothetical protein